MNTFTNRPRRLTGPYLTDGAGTRPSRGTPRGAGPNGYELRNIPQTKPKRELFPIPNLRMGETGLTQPHENHPQPPTKETER